MKKNLLTKFYGKIFQFTKLNTYYSFWNKLSVEFCEINVLNVNYKKHTSTVKLKIIVSQKLLTDYSNIFMLWLGHWKLLQILLLFPIQVKEKSLN